MSDLDAALAEKLGWTKLDGRWRSPDGGRYSNVPPAYSTTWHEAGQLVEEMHAKGWYLRFEYSEMHPHYRASFHYQNGGAHVYRSGSVSVPKHIAEAADAALEAGDE